VKNAAVLFAEPFHGTFDTTTAMIHVIHDRISVWPSSKLSGFYVSNTVAVLFNVCTMFLLGNIVYV
jgi:hypothetical protein